MHANQLLSQLHQVNTAQEWKHPDEQILLRFGYADTPFRTTTMIRPSIGILLRSRRIATLKESEWKGEARPRLLAGH
jgi:hypothetical protein